MLALIDVQYGEAEACAACVLAGDWSAAEATATWTVTVSPIAPYEPGRFYVRELPCVLAALARAPAVQTIIIDGYVWLDEAGTPGLGAHLYEALERKVPIVGVAKTSFKGSPMATHVVRGQSKRPLFVTSVGIDQGDVAAQVKVMHGATRIPTLISLVDRLARGHEKAVMPGMT